uniref:Uncharacterized protein n=1 Tax=Meloidogyne enterolobii TaxID=390850 RepID=A0A6V7UWE4_MELEN|nr:unnamed protein product [Meloidogyne enterolobii]
MLPSPFTNPFSHPFHKLTTCSVTNLPNCSSNILRFYLLVFVSSQNFLSLNGSPSMRNGASILADDLNVNKELHRPIYESSVNLNHKRTKTTPSNNNSNTPLSLVEEHPLFQQQRQNDPFPPNREESQQENSVNNVVEVDASPGFVKAAELLKNSIDERVDPCEDFFDFACGKWVANNPIPDDLTSYGHFSELREKVNHEMKTLFESPEEPTSVAIKNLKSLYHGCMNTEDLNRRNSSELLSRAAKFGYWPIISPNKWKEEEFDLTDLLVHVGRSRAIDVFVDVYVSLDQKNATRRLLNFDQGGLGLGASARDYYLNDTRYGNQMAAYKRYMIEKISSFARDAGTYQSDPDFIPNEVEKIINFEREFARILTPDEDRRNFTKMYNLHHLSEMQKVFNLMNWTKYFDWLVPSEMHEYLKSDPEIILAEPEYFDRLTKLLNSTPNNVLANYIFWRFASSWSFQLDERYDDIQQHFLKAFLGKKAKSPRWKDCASAASSRMSYASGAMYVRAHFDRSSKEAALAMIEDLRASFKAMLAVNDWMDPGTKEYALIKAEQMLSLIGYPDFLIMTHNLTIIIKILIYIQMIIMLYNIWSQRKAFRRLIEPVDREEFGTSSAVVNAFYSGVKNAITFPAAILQAPFFDRDFPKATNYGCIGAVIGHEITHGFDDQGAQFDGRGNLKDWWDPLTQKRFVERKKCIIDQYSAFSVPQTGLKVNGILTQGENIADNGGIKQAYAAYQAYLRKHGQEKLLPGLEKYNNEQLFFISYAQTWCGHTKPETLIRQLLTDPHSPYRYRVNGVVVNQPEFTNAFKCQEGAAMRYSEERRCSVW